MKVLSLTEPYATLIKNGVKTIETRSWKTNYRGKLYIHASSTKMPKEYKDNRELMSLVEPQELDWAFIAENIAPIIRSVHIDEFQDTNELQYEILAEIVKYNKEINVIFVGDINQGIFGSLGGEAKKAEDNSTKDPRKMTFEEYMRSIEKKDDSDDEDKE